MSQLQEIKDLPAVPARPGDGHKGTFGTVIVVGGCATMVGAPALAAGAALRAGAGLVKILTQTSILPAVLTIEPCATGIEAGRSIKETLANLDAADREEKAVLALGPGMGQDESAWKEVEAITARPNKMVIDADALNILSQIRPGGMTTLGLPQIVLTPHPGEFKRLAEPLGITLSPTNPAQRPQAAAALAKAFNAIVVLKGSNTVIADARRFRINKFTNPAMATAGSGDVLTGIIAALMAQGMTPWAAAALGTHLHSLAGDRWLQTRGPSGMTARELLMLIPSAFEDCRQVN